MTFGMYRSSQGGGITLDAKGRHSVLQSYRRNDTEEVAAYKDTQTRSYQSKYTLSDPSLLQGRPEFPGLSIQTIFPSLVVQQIQNTLAVRHIIPRGPERFELIFTYFGYADDDAEMQAIRRKQANLVGPAGLVSMEDGHAAEIVQQAIVRDKDAASVVLMGGRGIADEESLITETGIRGFWRYYRELMGFSVPASVTQGERYMDARELRFAVEELQNAYVHCIDSDRLEEWPDFFTDPCRYEVTTRENVDQGLPVGVIYCDSKGMLRDRIVALRQANIYGPHRYRHMVSAVRVTGVEGNTVTAETNYAVYRTMLDPVNYGHSELYSVGIYLDRVAIEKGVARFREKIVLVDTARILSLLVTPL